MINPGCERGCRSAGKGGWKSGKISGKIDPNQGLQLKILPISQWSKESSSVGVLRGGLRGGFNGLIEKFLNGKNGKKSEFNVVLEWLNLRKFSDSLVGWKGVLKR